MVDETDVQLEEEVTKLRLAVDAVKKSVADIEKCFTAVQQLTQRRKQVKSGENHTGAGSSTDQAELRSAGSAVPGGNSEDVNERDPIVC